MKHKMTLAIALVAVMVLSVIPLVSADSDAYSVKDGESAVGYSVKNLSDDDLKKILPESRQLYYAKSVMADLIEDSYANYDYSEVKVSDYKASEYWGASISNKEENRVTSQSISFKITFKATCNTEVKNELFFNEYQYESVIKEVGRDNLSQKDAVFEVSAHVESDYSYHSKIKYDANSLEELFATHENIKKFTKETLKADVKYTVNGKTTAYSVDLGEENSGRYDVTMDFGDTAMADVRNTTRVLMDTKVDQYGGLTWHKVKFNDKEVGPATYSYNPPDVDLSAYKGVVIIIEDIEAKYAFYTTDPSVYGPFRGDMVDESLRDDAKLKQFLADNGTVKDTFSAVESGADSIYQDMTFSNELKIAADVTIAVLAAIGVTVLIFVVVLIILLARKKKN